MRAIGGHWSHAGGWSVSRRHASLKYARNAEWWPEETHGETCQGVGGVFYQHVSAVWGSLSAPERDASRAARSALIGQLQELLTQGQRSLTERCQMQWDTPRERETDYQIRLLLTSPPLSLPPSLSLGCVPVLWHTTSLSLWTLQRPHLTLQCVWEFIREFKS